MITTYKQLESTNNIHLWLMLRKYCIVFNKVLKQVGAELCQALDKLEVIFEVGVELELKLKFVTTSFECGWVDKN